jgi:hypothetical protein
MVRGHIVLRLRRSAATLRTNGSFSYDFPYPLTLSVASAESKGRKAMHSFNVDAALSCAQRTLLLCSCAAFAGTTVGVVIPAEAGIQSLLRQGTPL